MSGLRIKAFSPESRMKRVAPSARKSLDLPAASAMKANNIIERYSLEEREQIAEILRILSFRETAAAPAAILGRGRRRSDCAK